VEYLIDYVGLVDRQAKIVAQEALGRRMLHDDFDPSWKRGDEPHGTMIFTDQPLAINISPEPRDLESEIDHLKAQVSTLDTKVKLMEHRIAPQ